MESRPLVNLIRNVPITVQKVNGGDAPRHAGHLIGGFQQDYLVIGGFEGVEFAAGERVIVRLVVDDKAVGFAAEIQEATRTSVRLYFINVPERVETVNLRKAERLRVFFPADVRVNTVRVETPEIQFLKAMVLNLSSGGCLFSSRKHVEPETALNISFSLPGERLVYSLGGTVLESRSNDSLFTQRIRFLEQSASQHSLSEISDWISQNIGFAVI